MKIRKAIKKIVALGMGASMLGATILGASAADLNAYPAPFVQNGKFAGTMVVGDNAAAEDVIGVSDIAMSLQYSASVRAGSGSATTTTVEGDAYEFTKSANKLNLYENLTAIRTTLTDEDLSALADGTFKGKSTESYTQTLRSPLASGVGWYDYNDVSEEPALYFKLDKDASAFNYTLNFGTAPVSDNASSRAEDFEDNKITILGKEYSITKAEIGTGTNMVLTLMSGAVQDTLEVGQTKTYTINGIDYEVTVMVVSGETSATAETKLIVNDEVTKLLSKDDTYALADGTDVGIKEVIPTKSGDMVQNLVEFYLGAEKLVLDGPNNEMDIGENSGIEDVFVTVSTSFSSDDIKLNSIEIDFTPGIDMYIPAGGKLSETAELEEETDYVSLLSKLEIDYEFAGLKGGNEEVIELKREDDDAIKIKFTNKNGDEYDVPIFYVPANGTVYLGEELSKDLQTTEGTVVCDEDYFIVENDETTRILQLKDIKNTSDSKYAKIKDLGTGGVTNYDFSETTRVADINLDGYTYQITVDAVASPTCATLTEITDDATGKALLWTKYGSSINLTSNATAAGKLAWNLIIREDKDQQEDDDSIDVFNWNLSRDVTNSVADFQGNVNEANELVMRTSDADSKKSSGYSKWGSLFERDTNGDQDEWKITIPEEEAIAEVFLTAGVTAISSSEGVSGDTVIVTKIDVGATKLASEVKDDVAAGTAGNLILVGGPCANTVVEDVSADFPTCAAWPLSPGEALIQIVEQDSGDVALLVAGSVAEDTRAATGIVAEMASLTELPAGVTKQKVIVSTGVLTEMPVEEVAEEAAEPAADPAAEPAADPAADATDPAAE